MGKLAELRDQLDELSDWTTFEAKELQKEINKIEEWCVEKGFLKGITKWGNAGEFDQYPWNSGAVFFEDIWMVGELNGKGINYNEDKSIHVS